MVTTRGQQPSGVSAIGIAQKRSKNKPNDQLETPKAQVVDREDETIGSRLRKRHRTGSFPTEDKNTRPKRSNLRKTLSPESKRTRPGRIRQNRSPVIEPPTNGLHPDSTVSPPSSSNSSPQPLVSSTEPGPEHASFSEPTNFSNIPPPPQRPLSSFVANDLASVIANIIDHGEQVDNLRGYDEEWGMVDTESLHTVGASLHLKTQSLPILDNLATQILNTLAKSTYTEILTIVTKPDSDSGQAYATLKSLFDHTKKVYAMQGSFLNPTEIGLSDPAHVDIIRKANLATFVSSVFGSQDVGFYHLNEYFLDTFVADGQRLLKSQAQLFLDLKTQAYISAMSSGQRSRDEILEDLFPTDLEEQLLSRRPGAKQLAPSEAEFLQRARNRCKSLLDEADTEDAIVALPDKYVWEDFLRDISGYVSKNFEMLVGVPAARKVARGHPSNGISSEFQNQQHQIQQHQLHQQQPQMFQQQQSPQAQQIAQQNHTRLSKDNLSSTQIPINTDDIAEKAARAAHIAMQGFGMSNGQSMHPQQQLQHSPPPLQVQYHFESHPPHHPFLHPHHPHHPHHPPHLPPPGYYHPQMNGPPSMPQHHQGYADQNGIPYPTQTAPTQVLYERARMAATAKASPSNRRGGTPSQRRPWSTEEENALMAGLDVVKGPHWSQILAMFGPGGTRNETLKDRNQVQLKDKARNLKLFFLKSGIEVPYYLQFVTGELKTRAPAQAAKHEERKRTGASEDRGTIDAAAISTEDAVATVAGTPNRTIEGGSDVVPIKLSDGAVQTVISNGNDKTGRLVIDAEQSPTTSTKEHQVEQIKQTDQTDIVTEASNVVPHRPHEPTSSALKSDGELLREHISSLATESSDDDDALEAARNVALQLTNLQASQVKTENPLP